MSVPSTQKENLPEGWVWLYFDNIKPSTKRFDPIKEKKKICIGLEHIEKDTGRIIGNVQSNNVTSLKTVFYKGDCLYGKLRPYLNKVAVPDFDGVCSTDILVFSKNPFIVNTFLKFCIIKTDFVKFANNTVSGVHHPRTSHKKLALYKIPLPPLNEQYRIVSKIESIFAQIDAGKEKLERVQVTLKHTRQAVLKDAFDGNLVPQDPDDEPADVMLKKLHKDSGKDVEFGKDGMPKGWVVTKLEHICVTKSGGTPSRKNLEYFQGDIPWIKSGELNDSIITSCSESISKQALEKSNATLFPKNTILMAMYGGVTIGKLSILGFNASTNQAICAFFHDNNILFNLYLFWFLRSIRKKLLNSGFGGVQKNISQQKLKQIPILIPPLNEQYRIVSKTESIFGRIDAKNKVFHIIMHIIL